GAAYHHAVDTAQGYAAQNERSDGRRQIHALRHPARRDDAVITHAGTDVAQRVAANGINRRDPALFLQRFTRRTQFITVDDVAGTQLFTHPSGFLRTAG